MEVWRYLRVSFWETDFSESSFITLNEAMLIDNPDLILCSTYHEQLRKSHIACRISQKCVKCKGSLLNFRYWRGFF